jgi:dTDP-4-dehydrorhamnose reductase
MLAQSIGKEAAKRGVKAFVELSSGLVYKSDSSPRKETDKLKPAIKHAQYKLQAEEELAKIEGLVVTPHCVDECRYFFTGDKKLTS